MRPWVLLFLLSGCSLFIRSSESQSAKGKQYYLRFYSNDWQEKNEKASDYVFENSKDGRILLSNSFCGEFQEESLEKLAGKTFITVDKFSPIQSKHFNFHEREAYRLEGTGFVDGVKVTLRILNTRRNNCYFDFVSISPPGTALVPDTDFESFLQSVEFK